LLGSGAAIDEVNTIRRQLSAIKGGRLAAAAAPATVLTLALSDVIGDRTAAIASGPTVPDPTSAGDARAVINRFDLESQLPVAVVQRLQRLREEPAAGPITRGEIVVVGDGATAARAAAAYSRSAGVATEVIDVAVTGEAREVGAGLAAQVLDVAGPRLLVWAGETTVTVRGAGRGGRNQEAALGAARVLRGRPDAVFLSLGTDGRDGPTDAAGGFADGSTVARGEREGFDIDRTFADNDAYRFLDAAGDLLRTGLTGTNVADLMLGYRD
jgi:glycerate-2-kinase